MPLSYPFQKYAFDGLDISKLCWNWTTVLKMTLIVFNGRKDTGSATDSSCLAEISSLVLDIQVWISSERAKISNYL